MADSRLLTNKSAIVPEGFEPGQPTAVLFSAGLDSAVLLAHTAAAGEAVPIYVSVGLAWEAGEIAIATRLLASAPFRDLPPEGGSRGAARVRPIVPLSFDMTDVYPSTHWAIRGEAPAFDTPDEDVYLEGRNIVLLSKAAVFMARAGITQLVTGTLAGNPFPDASATFFCAMGRAMSTGLARTVRIAAPFASMHKADVIRLGERLSVPFELTLSCMQPVNGLHCGRCSKCRERRDGFLEAGVSDPTVYAAKPAR